MPDFYVDLYSSPPLTIVPWIDPASATRPSRLTSQNDRFYQRVNAIVGTALTLNAILSDQSAPQPDSIVGLFTMWPEEFPSGRGKPRHIIPTPGVSSIQTFLLELLGHYTIVVRHEDTNDAPRALAGGCVVIHIESIPA